MTKATTRPAEAGTEKRNGGMRVGRIATDLVIGVVLLILLWEALGLSENARQFPLITIVVMLSLLLLDLAMEASPAVRRKLGFLEADVVAAPTAADVTADTKPEQAGVPQPEVEAEEEQPDPSRFRAVPAWAALAWLAGLGVLMVLFGYVVATPIFLLAFFVWVRAPFFRVAVPITAFMTALNYFVFFDFLRMM